MASRKPVVIGENGTFTELDSPDTLSAPGSFATASGTSLINGIVIVAGGTYEVYVPFVSPMPNANYSVTAFLNGASLSVLGSAQIDPKPKTKTVAGSTFVIKNTGLVSLTLTVGLTIVAVGTL